MTIETEKLAWNFEAQRFDPLVSDNGPGLFIRLGHVPMDWLVTASNLPGKALAVGLAIWALAIAVKKQTIMLTPKAMDAFEIGAAAKSRAITHLVCAELISVERRRGRFPLVTLIVGDEASCAAAFG